MEFELQSDYIELIKLLKVTQLCATGGEAKFVVESGVVRVDEMVETRKRRKIRSGMRVEYDGHMIEVR